MAFPEPRYTAAHCLPPGKKDDAVGVIRGSIVAVAVSVECGTGVLGKQQGVAEGSGSGLASIETSVGAKVGKAIIRSPTSSVEATSRVSIEGADSVTVEQPTSKKEPDTNTVANAVRLETLAFMVQILSSTLERIADPYDIATKSFLQPDGRWSRLRE